MKEYVSFSAWKRYKECESCALALDRGYFDFKATTAMKVSSYIEVLLTDFEIITDRFKSENPDMFKKDGSLKAEFKRAEIAVEQALKDDIFMSNLEGEAQKKLEGEFNGITVIGYCDYMDPSKKEIIDLKAMANFDRVWNAEQRKKVSFVQDRRYDVQGAVYQELWKQMSGEYFEFKIVALTKEEISQRKIITFPDEELEYALEEFTSSLSRIVDIRAGSVEPNHCGVCDHCKATLPTEEVDYKLVGLSAAEMQQQLREEFERRD